ncbi:MAG: hypothetical protein JSV93_00845 [Candidatus Omnitrophota bacterium]|nr:MAG: hypothetical protein JSV93_00845 [Candidatus Omnitrophota bacterium]
MIILGVSYLADAGACVVKDGVLKSVINEERLNRIKLFYGIPEMSIKWCLKDAGLKMEDVDVIVTQGYCSDEPRIEFIDHGLKNEAGRREEAFEYVYDKIRHSRLSPKDKRQKIDEVKMRYGHENTVMFSRNITIVRQLRKFKKPIKVVEHHISHAAGAYFASGWNSAYVITSDGWGEVESNIFCRARDGKLEKIYYSHSFDSLGYFYGGITRALGFTPKRHEGKVLSLAACGRPQKAMPWMKKMIYYNPKEKRFEAGFESGIYTAKFENAVLERLVKRHKKEDVAAAAQKVLEKTVCEYVEDVVPANSKLVVAGGIFANVRLNQKISELPNIRDIFVYPQMTDGGLAAGSALYLYSRQKKLRSVAIDSLYKGPAFDNASVLKEIKRFGYAHRYHEDIEKKIAELLTQNNVVMRFTGRMEYGPRALGNRSILFTTMDRTVNGWLNAALGRSKFMPFAPVTLKEKAQDCYKNIRNCWRRALYMTITFDCTDWMKKISPGVVHIDGTARPQLVTKDSNPSLYKILKHYYRLSGIPSLINTSFNMHEEPIVCSPQDALHAFHESKLKYLAIENYLVSLERDDILFQANNCKKGYGQDCKARE